MQLDDPVAARRKTLVFLFAHIYIFFFFCRHLSSSVFRGKSGKTQLESAKRDVEGVIHGNLKGVGGYLDVCKQSNPGWHTK